eukprot:RCo029486
MAGIRADTLRRSSLEPSVDAGIAEKPSLLVKVGPRDYLRVHTLKGTQIQCCSDDSQPVVREILQNRSFVKLPFQAYLNAQMEGKHKNAGCTVPISTLIRRDNSVQKREGDRILGPHKGQARSFDTDHRPLSQQFIGMNMEEICKKIVTMDLEERAIGQRSRLKGRTKRSASERGAPRSQQSGTTSSMPSSILGAVDTTGAPGLGLGELRPRHEPISPSTLLRTRTRRYRPSHEGHGLTPAQCADRLMTAQEKEVRRLRRGLEEHDAELEAEIEGTCAAIRAQAVKENRQRLSRYSSLSAATSPCRRRRVGVPTAAWGRPNKVEESQLGSWATFMVTSGRRGQPGDHPDLAKASLSLQPVPMDFRRLQLLHRNLRARIAERQAEELNEPEDPMTWGSASSPSHPSAPPPESGSGEGDGGFSRAASSLLAPTTITTAGTLPSGVGARAGGLPFGGVPRKRKPVILDGVTFEFADIFK